MVVLRERDAQSSGVSTKHKAFYWEKKTSRALLRVTSHVAQHMASSHEEESHLKGRSSSLPPEADLKQFLKLSGVITAN